MQSIRPSTFPAPAPEQSTLAPGLLSVLPVYDPRLIIDLGAAAVAAGIALQPVA
ncbi:MAG: hypothetical protein R6W76_16540 [Caldilinea sp.]